jgi:hypothetical protein
VIGADWRPPSTDSPVVTDATIIAGCFLLRVISSSGMGKSYMSSFFASIFGLTHPIGGEGGVCKYTSAKDMHCYAEKHNAMRVMVR